MFLLYVGHLALLDDLEATIGSDTVTLCLLPYPYLVPLTSLALENSQWVPFLPIKKQMHPFPQLVIGKRNSAHDHLNLYTAALSLTQGPS